MIIYYVEKKNDNDTFHSKLFGLFNNKFRIIFEDNKLSVSLNHILIQKIHLHDSLTRKL